MSRRTGRRGPAPPASSDARFRESVSQATDISSTAPAEEPPASGTDSSGSARRRGQRAIPILPAPARSATSWNWKTVLQAIAVIIPVLGVVGAVVAEAVKLDSGLGVVNEKLGHLVERIEKLVEGVGKIDSQTQDVKTDLHELRRDFDQQRLERAEQGRATTTPPAAAKRPRDPADE